MSATDQHQQPTPQPSPASPGPRNSQGMTIHLLPMFTDCVIPGCRNPVAVTGDACNTCRTAFGPYLTFTRDDALTAQQIADRDSPVCAAHHGRQSRNTPSEPTPSVRRPNQCCWLCEQRRTCTRQPAGWECDHCRTLI